MKNISKTTQNYLENVAAEETLFFPSLRVGGVAIQQTSWLTCLPLVVYSNLTHLNVIFTTNFLTVQSRVTLLLHMHILFSFFALIIV